jgi:uncharacterized membrane protein
MRVLLTAMSAALLLAMPASALQAADGDLQILFKAPGSSSARAINLAGSTIGSREVQDSRSRIPVEKPYFFSKGKVKEIPRLATFTANFPTALSDNELVVGYCSRVVKNLGNLESPGKFNLQAFVWDAVSGKLTGLPLLPKYDRSMAFGICADGSRISGVIGGAGTMNACIWDKGAAGWECKALPGNGNSLLLVTSGASISRDGNSICGVDGNNPARWTRKADGSWSIKVLQDKELFIPKAINDSGSIAGYRRAEGLSGHYRAVVWTDKDGLKEIGLLPNTRTSKALAINNAGLVVGVAEEPIPRGFTYQNGKLAALEMPRVVVSAAYAINEKGQIAGYCGRDNDDYVFAFVWTPAPK